MEFFQQGGFEAGSLASSCIVCIMHLDIYMRHINLEARFEI